MLKRVFVLALVLSLGACASVPMSSDAEDSADKRFEPPAAGRSALYIYRETIFGVAAEKGRASVTAGRRVIAN
ncbi:MAG: hypothetical protein FJX02_14225 [Alphaproteobacteria bacterium]|nr:hypothetical protein [Alphaproteobacteria bacterium]